RSHQGPDLRGGGPDGAARQAGPGRDPAAGRPGVRAGSGRGTAPARGARSRPGRGEAPATGRARAHVRPASLAGCFERADRPGPGRTFRATGEARRGRLKMPFAKAGDLRVHYLFAVAAGAPVLALSNSRGADLSMWQPPLLELKKRFRVLQYDTRGHGRTSVPDGPYTIEQLARDALRLL